MRVVLRAARDVALIALMLTGCGGGGGSGGAPPPPATVAPTITTAPQSLTVNFGQPAAFSVAASGTAPLAYQWRRNGADIAGATSAQYQFTSGPADDGASFSVVVSNAAGSVTSAGAVLSVRVPPAIVTQPSSVSIVAGQTGVFTVAATGTAPLQYQWRRNNVDIGGATAANYTTPPAAVTDDGAAFTVVVTNAAGSETSSAATLSVRAAAELSLFVGVLNGAGYFDGTGPAARFAGLAGVAIDAQGRLVVTDGSNAVVRRVDGPGVVTTLSGSVAEPGQVDGPAGTARFESLAAATTDSSGNALIVENNCRVRRVSPSGTATTVSPCHGGGAVTGAADDATGRIYTVDPLSHVVYVADAGAMTRSVFAGVSGQAGSADGAPGVGRMNTPWTIARHPAGGWAIAELSGAVRLLAADGTLSTLVGPGVDRESSEGTAVDAAGNVYVSSRSRHVVSRITASGAATVIAGAAGVSGYADGDAATTRFLRPWGIAVDAGGNVFVADAGNRAIRRISASGTTSTIAGPGRLRGLVDGTGSDARFRSPGKAAAAANGDLFVSDVENHCIRRITPAGTVTIFAGSATGEAGSADGLGAAARFNRPGAIAFDAAGNLYVADKNNHTIRRIAPNGNVETVAGQANTTGFTDGTGAAALFSGPEGITVDAAGNIWIADTNNSIIRRMSPSGNVVTYAGAPLDADIRNGDRTIARFVWPFSIVADNDGNLYVVENNSVRKIDTAGQVSTLAGSGGTGFVDGPGSVARFASPVDVAIDRSAGRLYVVDSANYRVRSVALSGNVSTVVGTAGQGKLVPGPLPGGVPWLYGIAFGGGTLYLMGEDGIARVTNLP